MGMGYGANYADTISEKDLSEIIGGDLVSKFYKAIDDADITISDWINDWENCDSTVPYDAITEIEDAFNEKTGLYVSLQYHGEDDGDRYDEINGYFWAVEGMYTLSEAGKKIADKVTRNFFVTFG
jgi:bacteriocin-like protein